MALQTCRRRSICCSARLSSLRVEQLGWCVDKLRNGEKPLVVLTFSIATVGVDVGKWWKTRKAGRSVAPCCAETTLRVDSENRFGPVVTDDQVLSIRPRVLRHHKFLFLSVTSTIYRSALSHLRCILSSVSGSLEPVETGYRKCTVLGSSSTVTTIISTRFMVHMN
jgi:hypothetical protein